MSRTRFFEHSTKFKLQTDHLLAGNPVDVSSYNSVAAILHEATSAAAAAQAWGVPALWDRSEKFTTWCAHTGDAYLTQLRMLKLHILHALVGLLVKAVSLERYFLSHEMVHTTESLDPQQPTFSLAFPKACC